MGNTWNGMTFENIANMGLSALEDALIPMQGFTTDFSTEIPQGTVVNTRIVPAASAPTDLVDNESNSYAAVVDDVATTTVAITLDPHPVNGFAFTDTEAQQIGNGVWTDTTKRLVKTHVRSIANATLNTVFTLITNANYSTAAFVGAASTFDADDVADLAAVAVNAGWDMSDGPVLVLTPSYYTALVKDNAVQDRSASGADTLQSGKLPMINGFRVIQAPTLPPFGSQPATENLVGFISQPAAAAIAMRGVDTQDRGQFLHYQILQDSITGAVITYSAIWTPTYRRVEHVFEALYGASKAQAGSLKRLTSA